MLNEHRLIDDRLLNWCINYHAKSPIYRKQQRLIWRRTM